MSENSAKCKWHASCLTWKQMPASINAAAQGDELEAAENLCSFVCNCIAFRSLQTPDTAALHLDLYLNMLRLSLPLRALAWPPRCRNASSPPRPPDHRSSPMLVLSSRFVDGAVSAPFPAFGIDLGPLLSFGVNLSSSATSFSGWSFIAAKCSSTAARGLRRLPNMIPSGMSQVAVDFG